MITNKDAWGNQFKDNWKNFDDYKKWILSISKILYNILNQDSSFLIFLDRKYTGLFIVLFEEQNYHYKNKIYFIKNNPIPHLRLNNYRSCVEECIWLSKDKAKINFLGQEEMKQVFYGNIGKKDTNHPTEKYLWMIIPIINRHSNKNDIVLDPFLGSGTTAIACEKTHRKWIGIEKNKEYCEMAKTRIKNYTKQIKLF